MTTEITTPETNDADSWYDNLVAQADLMAGWIKLTSAFFKVETNPDTEAILLDARTLIHHELTLDNAVIVSRLDTILNRGELGTWFR